MPTSPFRVNTAAAWRNRTSSFACKKYPASPTAIRTWPCRPCKAPGRCYRLEPISGKRHQLRVHMAALGLPLRNDPFYPEVNDPPEGDYSRPFAAAGPVAALYRTADRAGAPL